MKGLEKHHSPWEETFWQACSEKPDEGGDQGGLSYINNKKNYA